MPRTPEQTAAYAGAWLQTDPDPVTKQELADLLAAGDQAELADRFNSRIVFGTSGLRGPRGVGPNRMNRLVIAQAAAAIMRHLHPATVVIGFDGRHLAREFADEAAAMVADQGGMALVMAEPLPTPVMAHAFRYYGADAGMIITASHNPAADSGCKVYLNDGAQLVAPHDHQIEVVMAELADPPVLPHHGVGGQVSRARGQVVENYLDLIIPDHPNPALTELSVAYTALHGVAGSVFAEAMKRLNTTLHVVESQFDPDPEFPTVDYPNPEEPRAVDAVIALAAEVGADIAFSNDPDGDRLGVAIPDAATQSWRQLSGDQIGVLLGDHALRRTSGPGRITACTVVSSRLLSQIAASHGVEHIETLHGFKHVARAADDRLETRLIFGYEPALGYAVHDTIRDKDGISAAVAFLELVAELRSDGRTVLDRLDELAIEHGLHTTSQIAVWFDGLGSRGRMAWVMDEIRANPPAEIDGRRVSAVTDFAAGESNRANMLRFDLDDGSRVQIRPSGTEPKLKAYLELVTEVTTDIAAARLEAEQARQQLDAAVRGILAGLGAS